MQPRCGSALHRLARLGLRQTAGRADRLGFVNGSRPEHDPDSTAEQAFENVRRCLAIESATFDDVVKLTYYVTEIRFLAEIRTVRDTLMPGAEKPASTAVQVVALALPELLLEIEALAVVAAD